MMSAADDEIYFSALARALTKAGCATPTLIVDKKRLEQNIDLMLAALPEGMGYRIVAKSLPAYGLIDAVRIRTGTNRLMVFNFHYLQMLARDMPKNAQDVQFLLGKPLPVAALEKFFKELTKKQRGVIPQIEFLADMPARIQQYEALARAQEIIMRINLELDVGLHRGGLADPQSISAALGLIDASPHLAFSGFMGYEPHLGNLPQGGWRDRAKEAAWEIYKNALDVAQAAGHSADEITRNAAGSPTYRLYKNTDIANEVSVGSVLVKPTDFDTDLLAVHLSASFIAAPVLKAYDGIHVPALEFADRPTSIKVPQDKKTIFIYGGKWMASPVWPEGIENHKIFGRSSNQEMLAAPADCALQPDDFVFFRPHQSEAVFLQFGDIAVYDEGEIKDFWPVFPAAP